MKKQREWACVTWNSTARSALLTRWQLHRKQSEGAVTLFCFYLSAGGPKPGSHPEGQWPQRSLMGTYVICSGMEIEANEIAESRRKRRQDVRGEDGGAVQHLGVKSKVRMWEMPWGRQKGDWNRQGLALIWMELLVSWRWRLDTAWGCSLHM